MDDLINIFVTSTYTQETQEDIFQALGLFRVFNNTDPFPLIDELLMMESYQEPSSLADSVINVIIAGQEFILDRHGIILNEETTLAFNNVILKTLYQLQRLEDPVPVLKTLESQVSDLEKFSEIMEMFNPIPATTFIQLVDTLRPVFLSLLADFLYGQESAMQPAVKAIPRIRDMSILFKQVFGINVAIRAVLDSGVLMGEPFILYLPLYKELQALVEDETQLVHTLLFLLLYSEDGIQDPLKTFAEYSDQLVPDLTTSNRLENTLGQLYDQILRHKEKLSHEQA